MQLVEEGIVYIFWFEFALRILWERHYGMAEPPQYLLCKKKFAVLASLTLGLE